MAANAGIKKHNKSIIIKIIITCLLACVTIVLSLYISRFTFTKMLSTVGQLSKPNPKIQLVNSLFRNVVQLDQLQRNQELQTQMQVPEGYNPFIRESGQLQGMLDSLRTMSKDNKPQVVRVDSMKHILLKRDSLFLKYLGLHAELERNDTLALQLKKLSELLDKAKARSERKLITTSKSTKTVIDTLQPKEEKPQSLWTRIFVKKKAEPQKVQKKIEEDLKVRVDTFVLDNKGDSLARMSKAIARAETERVAQRALLIQQQQELNVTGDILITQLITILNDVDATELAHAASENAGANLLVKKGISNISHVLLIFILGTCVLVFLIFTDIARGNQYRRQLVAAKEEAEEAGRVKQRFLANMSHELRTPLQTIIGISEQIRMVKQLRRQDLENIYQSSLHLLQIVNEVLDYSRIISGKYVIEQKPFSLYRLLAEVKEMIQVQVDMKRLELIYEVAIAADDYYSGDEFRLKQVLLNLLGNAVKFTDKGSVSLSVSEAIQADGSSVCTFIVKDTGIGIAKEDIGIVFNQFEQGSSNTRKIQGTGLGLSIVKALIDQQKGTIKVQSERGSGTMFTVTLHYKKTIPAEVDAVTVPAAIAGYKEHVWIVDDDMFILQLCDSILNKHGVPHTCFSSAREALATPFPAAIGIVFLDIRMAEMDGITLCRKLKERQVAHVPRYIALTAQALPDERETIMQHGFDGLVMKPFLEQDFINAVYQYALRPQQGTHTAPDLSSVYKMTGGDPEVLDMVLRSFITETGKDMASAMQSIKDNDIYELADALHKLASRCGQLGMTPLSQRLRLMEIALHEHREIEETKAKMNGVYRELDAMMTDINELRKKGNLTA